MSARQYEARIVEKLCSKRETVDTFSSSLALVNKRGSGGTFMTETNQVLLVDDDGLIRTMVGDMVSEAGFVPVVTASAKEAIGCLASLEPIAAFIDLYMPEISGDECCKIMKSNEELSHVPVVVMTAAAEEEVQRAFLSGADDFLPKPVNAYQMLSKLKAGRDGHRRAPKRLHRDMPFKRILIADDEG